MNSQPETKQAVEVAKMLAETVNPMQERHCGEVAESVEVTAEAIFMERRLETREEAGPVFIP